MTKKQYIELTNILEELEWDYGYGPSFEITEASDIFLLRTNMYNDFKNISNRHIIEDLTKL